MFEKNKMKNLRLPVTAVLSVFILLLAGFACFHADTSVQSGEGEAYQQEDGSTQNVDANLEAPILTNPEEPTKRALLIGVGQYADYRIRKLNGPKNDVALMKTLLVTSYGFQERHITTLIDAEATKEGIIDAILGLADSSDTNDVVVVHYSGHGSYKEDSSGEEADLLDETIVPYDSDTDGSKDITDDEIQELLQALAAKVPNITFILDSCHSGSASRSPYSIPRIVERPAIKERVDEKLKALGRKSLEAEHESFLPENIGFAFFSAARSYQYAMETRFKDKKMVFGALTYFLEETLREHQQITNQELIEDIQAKMASRFNVQEPDLEGTQTGRDRLVFGTEKQVVEPYLIARREDDLIRIEGGQAHIVTDSSIYDIYSNQVRVFDESAERLARVRIVQVLPFYSYAEIIDNGSVPDTDEPKRAVLREYHYGSLSMYIALKDVSHSKILQDVKKLIDNHKALHIVGDDWGDADLLLVDTGHGIRIEGTKGMPLLSDVPLSDTTANHTVNQLEQWLRWMNIRESKPATTYLNVDVELQKGNQKGKKLFLKANDIFTVSIANPTDFDLWVNLINLTSSGKIQVFWPPYQQAQIIRAGTTHKTLPIPVKGLDGKADVDGKVVVTSEPVSLKILQQGAIRNGVKSNPSSLEQYFERSMLDATRGDGFYPLGDWTTVEAVVYTEPK